MTNLLTKDGKMRVVRRWTYLLILVCLGAVQVGCTHRQLRYDHVVQARTLTTIYEQQVLDNLAMFSHDANSLPFFAIPGTGSASVSDNGGLNVSPINSPGRVLVGPFAAGRTNNQSWALIPVTDAGKLERMQLLYQEAIASGVASKSSKKRFATAECDLKGTYCGHHIQICGNNRAAFTRLALAILAEAVNDPAPTPTAEIQDFSYNDDGTVKRARKYNVDARTENIQGTGTVENGMSQPPSGGSGTRILNSSPGISSPVVPRAFRESERIRGVITEQQRQILRGTIFPGQ